MKNFKNTLLTSVAIVGITFGAVSAEAANPYQKPDQAEITLTGDVISQVGDSFTLDYGDGVITVEMDDWAFHNEANWINPGETVMVSGEIDNDLYELKTIEAESVYVADRATFYYANDVDEEDTAYMTLPLLNTETAPEGTIFGVTGTVEDVDVTEFSINAGLKTVKVETAYLGYDPLDDEGYQQIEEGDRVFVTGILDKNFFNKNEIDAQSIITLSQDTGKKVNETSN